MVRPEFILFAQHGWADTAKTIGILASQLTDERTIRVVPDLGWLKTWWRIDPLVESVEKIAIAQIQQYPELKIDIIGHSMGGLIWLEVLNRHPEWEKKIRSLILIACPIGGADLGRIFDPFNLGIGIAKDLGKNRRVIAEKIAQKIPTLTIAGDMDNGSDGTITIESSKFFHSTFTVLPNVDHAALKNHPDLIEPIKTFWLNPIINLTDTSTFENKLIAQMRSLKGITDAHRQGFAKSQIFFTFSNGYTIRLWKNIWQVSHVFLANPTGDCCYAGFVGWQHEPRWEELLRSYGEEI